MRWYGPKDPVPLRYLRQAGAEGVFSALHEIPYGEVWPRTEIRRRKELIEDAGLRWVAVESLPVHEDIKTGRGEVELRLDNYRQSLRNLAAEGIEVVIYNFMPVLDWVRTDIRYVLDDGSESLRFDPIQFAAFEVFALARKGAKGEYSSEQLQKAEAWWESMTHSERDHFSSRMVNSLPGVDATVTLDQIRMELAKYAEVGRSELSANFAHFLQSVVPEAADAGIKLAVHPDDPPFPVLGLPRIVSTEEDLAAILKMAPDLASGICFCTGSLGVRGDNDLVRMVRRFGQRIYAVHLRSTQREPDGSFYEADHLAGAVDMPGVVCAILEELKARPGGSSLPFRPDHGHRMMDDLEKPISSDPGYTCIGRMRGLAELRGLILGLSSPRN